MKPKIQIQITRDGHLYFYHEFGKTVVIQLTDLNGAISLISIPTNAKIRL